MKIGKYELIEVIGEGGMGIVYRAHDPSMDRPVALKMMQSAGLNQASLRERFYREARAAGKLRHPNIVVIYELAEEKGVPYIAMEYLEGADLKALFKKKEPMPLDRKIRILSQLCRGLAHAHQAGIVHRDIKPSNVMLLADGQVKILDFGIARLISSKSSSSGGNLFGSVYYMSPEQVRGQKLDARSDIFSAGILLYELLTYSRPFTARQILLIADKIMNQPPAPMHPPLDEQYPALKRILSLSLEKDLSRRYQTAGQMADDLDSLLQELGTLEPVEEVLPSRAAAANDDDRTQAFQRSNPELRETIRKARRLFAEGSVVQAHALLQKAMKSNPGDSDLQELSRAVEQDAHRVQAEELLARAQRYAQDGEPEIAIKALEKVLRLQPDHPKARLMIEDLRNKK